jgi:hypothetical protein
MSTLRDQAAAAAAKWFDSKTTVTQLAACAAGYLLGHAAGVEEGARRFAEMLAKDVKGTLMRDWLVEHWEEFSLSFSSLAPGTTLAEAEGQKEEG